MGQISRPWYCATLMDYSALFQKYSGWHRIQRNTRSTIWQAWSAKLIWMRKKGVSLRCHAVPRSTQSLWVQSYVHYLHQCLSYFYKSKCQPQERSAVTTVHTHIQTASKSAPTFIFYPHDVIQTKKMATGMTSELSFLAKIYVLAFRFSVFYIVPSSIIYLDQCVSPLNVMNLQWSH